MIKNQLINPEKINKRVVKKRKTSFYLAMGIVALFAAVTGFFTTYITPSIQGSFTAPMVIHIHGAFAFTWVVLFLAQTVFIKSRNFQLHRSLGFFGLFIAIGIAVSMPAVGIFQVDKGLAEGRGESAYSVIIGIIATALMFILLVGAGYYYRKKPKIHKRLLLLSTIILLWPAWFRFRHYFPNVPNPEVWFGVVLADSFILLSWIMDRITYGKIHPVLLYGGLFIIAEHIFEVVMYDSKSWREWSIPVYNLFS